jgi:hypothetical protein
LSGTNFKIRDFTGPSRERSRWPRRRRRRFARFLVACAVMIALAVTVHGSFRSSDSFSVPNESALADLSQGSRIAAVAESQVGYRTEPSNSYCNKFSAYWDAGVASCQSGELSEEWCADFAAWVWQVAGVKVPYGYDAGEINAGAASFYKWGVANGKWHPAKNGYVAAAGDVAIYGLSLGSYATAAHVAIVIHDGPDLRGPNVVNGDGDRTGFSVVEFGTDQTRADVDNNVATLSGYVSPP